MPNGFEPPRRLRIFAFDPWTAIRPGNRNIREVTLSIPSELDPIDRKSPCFGPSGEYIEVVDFDSASGRFYQPIDLNSPEVLFNDGLTPAADDPRFHQQMVYAVAMETIGNFERALGRYVLWSPRKADAPQKDSYVPRLRLYPHALREANAYYDPARKAVLFGYFQLDAQSRAAPPGTVMFTCLSQDIIVHEMCHAILDGMHPHFVEPSNPDMLALHEAFSDIVAIFQHFSHAGVLQDQIGRTGGDLERQSLLGALAQEFGQGLGRSGALRDAIGGYVDGEWQPHVPDNTALRNARGPHARGAILVAAVFRAFLNIYRTRVADLFRIASGGSGILRPGSPDPDLVKRLADEAATSARHMLNICIRAMDYVPPVNVSFGDYLRAVITADHDLFPEDAHGYRAAFLEAFAAWGIVPDGMPVLSEGSLIWPSFEHAARNIGAADDTLQARFGVLITRPDRLLVELRAEHPEPDGAEPGLISLLEADKNALLNSMNNALRERLKATGNEDRADELSKEGLLQQNLLELEFTTPREVIHHARRFYARLFWGIVVKQPPALLRTIGICMDHDAPQTIRRSGINGLPAMRVRSVRVASRLGNRGHFEREYVVELVQSRDGYLDHAVQELADSGQKAEALALWNAKNPFLQRQTLQRDFTYRTGCTLLIDTRSFRIRRVICTPCRIDENAGLEQVRAYYAAARGTPMNAFDAPETASDTSFAALHRHVHHGQFHFGGH
ncbi:hypothetical protein [Roseinatronobacter alkalisoli]|uniref:Peptidase M4 n=1 Tax=Roseinatronobacter alkalisoli TaxID=3028235 RepID=A0ABT5T9E0_9RHOB|nr:hypothetical protein [Roseinatronobacter sp. HJB301]MDD7971584.1 hypothetical protein [Roseinatronobacter sp. HJB301]